MFFFSLRYHLPVITTCPKFGAFALFTLTGFESALLLCSPSSLASLCLVPLVLLPPCPLSTTLALWLFPRLLLWAAFARWRCDGAVAHPAPKCSCWPSACVSTLGALGFGSSFRNSFSSPATLGRLMILNLSPESAALWCAVFILHVLCVEPWPRRPLLQVQWGTWARPAACSEHHNIYQQDVQVMVTVLMLSEGWECFVWMYVQAEIRLYLAV